MSAVNIPMLKAAIAITGNEWIEAVQGPDSVRVTARQISILGGARIGIPTNPQIVNYTAVAEDNSFSINMNGADLVGIIPSNASVAFLVGAVLIWVNLNSSALTVSCDDTLIQSPGGAIGPRTVAQYGRLVAQKVTPTSWLCWGTGIS